MKTIPSSLLVLLSSSSLGWAGDIVANNPFIPSDWAPPSDRKVVPEKAPEPMNLELHGIDEWNGVKSFYLYDKVKQSGRWVVLNDSSADTPITALDDSGESTTITVRLNGRSEKLSLKKSDGKPLEIKTFAAAAPPPAAVRAPGGEQPGQPGQPNGGKPGIPGYNPALPHTDPANAAALKAFQEARQAERNANGGKDGQPASNIPAPVGATTSAAPAVPAPAATEQAPANPPRRPQPTYNGTDRGTRRSR